MQYASNRYVFLNADGVVVQAIAGSLTSDQVESFLADYRVLFSAESVVEVPDDATKVWIGGKYEAGAFLPAVVEEPVYVYDSDETSQPEVEIANDVIAES